LARLVARAAGFRPGRWPQTPTAATKLALRSVAVRYQHLSTEIAQLDRQLHRLVAAAAPQLLALKDVGTDTAAALLLAAGDNSQRLRSEAAFARLCGVAPIPASSGKTSRHRLSRGGNRDANRALYMLVVGRLRWDPRTRADVTRRTKQGKTRREALRCLIGGVSGAQPAQESGLLVVRVRGRPRCLATQMASLSCAASGRAEP
jgi:transposase